MANNNSQNEVEVPVAVVMVPYAEQGHINMLLHLSRLISAYNIPVHFVSTTTHGRQAKSRLHGWNPLEVANIHFHELPMPSFSNPESDNYSSQNLAFFQSLMNLREPVSALAQKISVTARKIVVIYDSLMAYVVQDIRSVPDAESYCFYVISAFSIYAVNWELEGRPALPCEDQEAEIGLREVPPIDQGWFGEENIEEGDRSIGDAAKFHSGDLFNTSRVIEGLYLDLIAKQKKTGVDKLWAMGPFNPVLVQSLDKENNSGARHKCLEWLDEQEERSVVYVSFGTTSTLSDEQIAELALGLEESRHKFLWVLRDADTKSADEGDEVRRKIPLPDGYEERVQGGRGFIVREWAPQLEILGHPSTGAFISHCGWNSCLEAISVGLPIGTWPMRYEQPMNAALMTKILKIGIEVREWVRRDELLPSAAVEEAVRKLMEGEEMRKRAAELGVSVRKSVVQGGESRKEMDSFIRHITRSS